VIIVKQKIKRKNITKEKKIQKIKNKTINKNTVWYVYL